MKRFVLIAALAACRGENMSDIAKLERLTGASLADRRGLHVGMIEKEDVGYYFGHARFEGDQSTFEAFCRELGLGNRGTTAAGGVLPTSWDWATSGTPPAWWSPSKDTPPAACARRLGHAGWVAAKLEGSFIYLLATAMPPA
jgi:hypothetical protein